MTLKSVSGFIESLLFLEKAAKVLVFSFTTSSLFESLGLFSLFSRSDVVGLKVLKSFCEISESFSRPDLNFSVFVL